MLSKFIALPFVIVTLVCFYLIWENKIEPLYVVPFVVMLAVIYVSSPQIDWWWAKRNPQAMDPKIDGFLNKFFPYYRSLELAAKKRFAHRVNLNILGTNFIPKAMEDVPEDVKALIAANVVMLTMGLETYRFSAYESIVVYPHPFPSPQYPAFHASEVFEEDGVLLLSLEQMIPGATQQTQYYNTALHEYANIFIRTYPDHPYPNPDEEMLQKLEQISGFKMSAVRNYIGLTEVDPVAVSINYFFTFPTKFKASLPELYATYERIYNQNPLQSNNPIIDEAVAGKM